MQCSSEEVRTDCGADAAKKGFADLLFQHQRCSLGVKAQQRLYCLALPALCRCRAHKQLPTQICKMNYTLQIFTLHRLCDEECSSRQPACSMKSILSRPAALAK